MSPSNYDPQRILQTLVKHDVQFIVVGGVCAVLHGVPLTTNDLDIVYSATPDNIQKLLLALRELDAIYRDLAGRRIEPTASALAAAGHNLLLTNAGAFDVLGSVGNAATPRRYADLLPDSAPMQVGGAFQVQVVDLPTLIALKQAANRDKDIAVLPLLQGVLAEKLRQQGDS